MGSTHCGFRTEDPVLFKQHHGESDSGTAFHKLSIRYSQHTKLSEHLFIKMNTNVRYVLDKIIRLFYLFLTNERDLKMLEKTRVLQIS